MDTMRNWYKEVILFALDGFAGHGRALGWGFENMCVTWVINDFASSLLLACVNASDPVIGKNLIERCSLNRINLQHTTNDVSTFPWQYPKKTPWAFDNFWALARRLSAPWKRWCFFASRAGGPIFMGTGLATLLLDSRSIG